MNLIVMVVPWVLSFASIVVAWRSVRSAENIAKFNAYFTCKSSAYNKLIEQLTCFLLDSSAPIEPLATANYQAAIYGSDDVRAALLSLSIQLKAENNSTLPSQVDLESLLTVLQKDLETMQ